MSLYLGSSTANTADLTVYNGVYTTSYTLVGINSYLVSTNGTANVILIEIDQISDDLLWLNY